MSNFFTLPGEYILQLLALNAPGIASLLGVVKPEESTTLTIVLSVFFWVIACVASWGSIRLVQNLYRITDALFRTVWFRITETAGNMKTRAVCNFRQLIPQRQPGNQHDAMPEMQFDDFDFTVLQATADRGPGFTTSAAELASVYGLRPAQFQNSLSKLHNSKMITAVIGSADGFDKYRLTDFGAAYLKMWDRQQAS